MMEGELSERSLVRVAFVTHGFLPAVGGAETHIALAASETARRSKVRILTSSLCLRHGGGPALSGSAENVRVGNVSLETLYLPSVQILNEKFILPWGLFRALARFRPQLVWSSHPSLSAAILVIYRWLRGAKWVASYHADVSGDRFSRRVFTRLEPILLRRADFVWVSSVKYAERLASRGIRRSQIVVSSPFTLSENLGYGSNSPVPQDWVHGQSHPYLFVGTLDDAHSYKHPEDLISSIADLKTRGIVVHAAIAGDGDKRPRLEELAQKSGVADLFRFCGRVSDSELQDLYRSAWALVLPSVGESEGFGLVVLEALSHRCPVVASDAVPGANRFAKGLGAVTFRAGDVSHLGETLSNLALVAGARSALAEEAGKLDLAAENGVNLRTLVNTALSLAAGPPGSCA